MLKSWGTGEERLNEILKTVDLRTNMQGKPRTQGGGVTPFLTQVEEERNRGTIKVKRKRVGFQIAMKTIKNKPRVSLGPPPR